MAIDKITSAGLTTSTNQPNFRNIIINGDMSIAQRSTSASSLTSSGYNTVDRFRIGGSSFGTWTQSQSTDVPTGQGFATSLKMDCTTANGSLGAGDHLFFQQRVEGQNLQYLKKGTSSAESTTLSFWVKSNKTGTYIAELRDQDNSRTISKSYTISSADTWEKKTITYEGDTTGAFGNDNGRSLDVTWWLAAGSDFTSGTLQTSWGSLVAANRAVGQVNLADSTSNEWYITGVQLEAGTTASDFEFLPVDVNLQRCRRYYQILSDLSGGTQPIGIGFSATTSRFEVAVSVHPVMRSAPTLEYVSGSYYTVVQGSGDVSSNTVAANTMTPYMNLINITGGTYSSVGTSGIALVTNNAGRVSFVSEL